MRILTLNKTTHCSWRTALGLSALSLAALPLSALGQVTAILDESFVAGQRLTQDLPDTSAWYGRGGTLTEISGGISLDSSEGSAFLITYFTDSGAFNIGIGSSLEVTYQFRLDTAPNVGTGLRVAVFDSGGSRVEGDGSSASDSRLANYTGYGMFANPGSTNNYSIRERIGSNNNLMFVGGTSPNLVWTTGTSGTVNNDIAALAAGVTYTGVFTVARTDADAGTITHTITGPDVDSSVSVAINSGLLTSFDTFAIGLLGATTDASNNPVTRMTGIELDSVTIIPEPSTYAALAGLLALGLVIVRRRMK